MIVAAQHPAERVADIKTYANIKSNLGCAAEKQKPAQGGFCSDRSHAPRGNAARDGLRPCKAERGASEEAFPRRAWERSSS
jgi:hypothetical protein